MRIATVLSFILLTASVAQAEPGFLAEWETPGCPASCKYQDAYEIRAYNAEFDVKYDATGGVSRFFEGAFALPSLPSTDVTFSVRSVDGNSNISAWSNEITKAASLWATTPGTTLPPGPSNPHVPTLFGVEVIQ